MERRSEVVEGLEALRETILGYDAAADPKGAKWDVLRVELDREVLNLIIKAQRLEPYGEVPAWAKGAAKDLELGALDSEATTVKFVQQVVPRAPSLAIADLNAWMEFRREVPAMWDVASPTAGIPRGANIDIGAAVKGTGFEVWGESDRARDFIAQKLKVRARIGKLYRVNLPLMVVQLAPEDAEVTAAPYLVGEGPTEPDPSACLVRPRSEAGSIWVQNQAADGVRVMRGGQTLGEAETSQAALRLPTREAVYAEVKRTSDEIQKGTASSTGLIRCRSCYQTHPEGWSCPPGPSSGHGVRG